MLRVATFNIRNTTDRYTERQPLLEETILALDADILGCQEVNFEEQTPMLRRANKMPVTVVEGPLPSRYPGPPDDPAFRIDGNTLSIRQCHGTCIRHDVLRLSQTRIAHRVLLSDPQFGIIAVVNAHLHHELGDSHVRHQQTVTLCEWLEKASEDDQPSFTIVMGDFNAPPHEPSYALFEQHGFSSAFKLQHGSEPVNTFKTGLQAPTMDRDPQLCVDYIWVKAHGAAKVEVLNVRLAANMPHPQDDTLYPSDHFAIVAELFLTGDPLLRN